ncbi:Uncharacterised protein [Burkholderia pseudomallei]|nr:Uncharacterised protein [Burkholderia pseudomallei]CAJ7179557.1 Uncharacterised protein [Burkholderia pseudomallei]CAJ9790411.1 Uncharacterised protein [Burkholderia pseudomallei]
MQARRALVQLRVQRVAAPLDLRQHGHARVDRQRILVEGAREQRGLGGGRAVVAVAPRAAVHGRHHVRAAGERADRQAAAEDLAVRDQVRLHAEVRLRAARGDPETGDQFVEDQQRARLLGQRAQAAQERRRLQVRPPALHRLDEHGRHVPELRGERVDARRVAVIEHQRIGDGAARDAGHERRAARRGIGRIGRVREDAVEMAVVRAAKDHDALAPGDGTGKPQRDHHRLAARVHERDPVLPGQPRDDGGRLARAVGLRAEPQPARQALAQRGRDEVRRMPEQVHAEAHREVEIAVAVDILERRARRRAADDRIQHLLDRRAKAGARAAVGHHVAIARGERAGAGGAARVVANQLVEVRLPAGRQRVAHRVRAARRAHGGHRAARVAPVAALAATISTAVAVLAATVPLAPPFLAPTFLAPAVLASVAHAFRARDFRAKRPGRVVRHLGLARRAAAFEQIQLPAHQRELLAHHLRDEPGRRRRGRRPVARRRRSRRLGGEIRGERLHRRQFIEERPHRDAHAERGLDLPGRGHQHETVRAHLDERHRRIDTVRRRFERLGDRIAQLRADVERALARRRVRR